MNEKRLTTHDRRLAPLFGRVAPVFPGQGDLNRLFEGLFDNVFDFSPLSKGQQDGSRFNPSLNLTENQEEIVAKLEIPGMKEDDIDITLTDNVLHVKGEKKEDFSKDSDKLHFVGRSYGKFEQNIPLNVEIDEDRVEASSENGVLTIRLPKRAPEKEKVRKISVKSA